MVAHGDEQVEEQRATVLHLGLHGAAPFECISAADDEGQVVCPQLGVVVGSVGVGIASRR